MNFETFDIPSLSYFLKILKPNFHDLVPQEMPYRGTLNEFTLMDNVVSSRNIIDIRRMRDIMERRDQSCDINYKKVAGATTRKITVEELVSGVKHCKHEFYQGCLKDFRNNDPLFGKRIAEYFKDAFFLDLAGNSYFGDVSRAAVPGYGLNKYDGIWKWIQEYYTAGVIPAAQSYANPGVDLRQNPMAAFAIIENLYDKMSPLMRTVPKADMAYYVSQPVLDGFLKYMQQTGNGSCCAVDHYTNGITVYAYNGIKIFVEPIWEDILLQLNPTGFGSAAVLTVRGNFVFATDKNYGEEDACCDNSTGEARNLAMRVWYDKLQLSWFYQMFQKAGTQIALPEYITFSI